MDEYRIPIGSLKDFFDHVLNGKDDFFASGKKLWYRGLQDDSYLLVPSLYRLVSSIEKDKDKFWVVLREYEDLFLEQFKARSYHAIPRRLPENTLMWFSIMQHYGTRTRFLDWSENVLTALFFALENYLPSGSQTRKAALAGKNPCLWVFNPIEFNNVIRDNFERIEKRKDRRDDFRNIKYPVVTSLKSGKDVPTLLEISDNVDEKDNPVWDNLPIAAIAPYNSERIESQEGTFLIFPCKDTFFEQIKVNPPYSLFQYPDAAKFLRLFVLAKPDLISSEVQLLGVKKSKSYPELQNIAAEIEDRLMLGKY
jgi:hypothetical protein